MTVEKRRLAAWLGAALLGATTAGCVTADAITGEQAAIERDAIDHDIRYDFGTLRKIAENKAKFGHPELRDTKVWCGRSKNDIRFTHEWRAICAITYDCRVRSQPEDSPPFATPTIKLEVLKEHAHWMINSFVR